MQVNGEYRPAPGGRCEAVWKACDKLLQKGPIPNLDAIMRVSVRRRWNPNNTRTEYYGWRKSKGIHGRLA